MRSTAVAALVAGLAFASPALAADPAEETGGSSFFSSFDWVVGGVGVVYPAYEGSDEYEVIGFPLIYPQFRDDGGPPRLIVRGADDFRYSLLRTEHFLAGPVAGWDFGRDDSDAALINGIGDVDGGLVIGAWAGLRMEPFLIDAAYATKVTGDDTGFELRFSAGVEQPVSERLTLSAFLTSEYMDDDYADAYFSITPAQAGMPGVTLPVYNADGGFKNVGVRFAAEYALTDRWTAYASAGYQRLIGDAASSPVVADENQFSGALGLTYRFGNVNNK